MPLQIEVEAEHPDVTALKQKVREVAQSYTRRHGWCREVKNALREAGIEDERKVNVEITFTVAGSDEQKTIAGFQVSDLAGKSDEEQKALVAEKIAPKVNVAGAQVTIPVTIVDLNESDKQAVSGVGGLEYPDNMFHFYVSDSGRVAHLANKPLAVVEDRQNVQQYIDAQRSRGHAIYAICGETAYYPTSTSIRSENRICQNCASRAQR